MTTAKRLSVRRRLHAELARQDRAARCAHCKAPLGKGTWVSEDMAGTFCSGECLAAEREAAALERIRALRCPECGQPVDLMTLCTDPVTDPKTGLVTMYRKTYRYCPSAFHLVIRDDS